MPNELKKEVVTFVEKGVAAFPLGMWSDRLARKVTSQRKMYKQRSASRWTW
jgi:hypothetical protein